MQEPGDTVGIEPDERHWHGAGPRTFMTHLAVVAAADGTTTGHAHVTDHPARAVADSPA